MAEAPVLVAGAGIAGLTAALAFSRRGFPVRVLERAARLEEAGAGIQLSPNAARRLFALGLEAPLRAAAAQPEAVSLRDAGTLRELASVRLGAWGERRWGAPYLTCHRADLQRVLLDAAGAEPRIALRLDAAVSTAAPVEGGIVVSLANGAEPVSGRFLAAADGVHSAVRAHLHGDAEPRLAGLTAWRRTFSPDEAENAHLFEPDRVGAFLHPRAHLVAYPMRGGAFNAVAIAPTRGAPGGEADREGLLAAFSNAAPVLIALLAAPGWTAWPILLAPPLPSWSDGARIALLGDAAHAILPFAAQGAAMAVEDAVTLADAFAAPGEGLARWEQARRARIAAVEARGRLNRLAWHAAGPVALARNLVLRFRPPERLAAELDWLYGG